MVGRPLLSTCLLLFLLQTTESIQCHGMLYKEDGDFMKFCEVIVSVPENKENRYRVEFNNNYGWNCKNSSCEHSKYHTRCCCTEDFCNTVSFALLSRAQQQIPPSGYYSVAIVAVVVLSQVLVLLLAASWEIFRPFKETFPKKMHVDMTRFTIPVKNLAHPLNPLVEMGHDGDLDMKGATCLAVVSYGCDETLTIIESNVPSLANYGIDGQSTMEDILNVVMKIGPKEISYDAATTIRILEAVREVFKKECTLLRLNPPIAVYADMHGQYSDLWRWFQTNGWPNRTKSIFLGDYVDRGRHSTEVYLMLSLLKVNFPSNMFMLRGNHEDGNVCRHYTFFNEVSSRFGKDHEKVFEAFEETFCMMPMSALIGKKILCMHGGLTPRIETLAQIEAVPRPTKKEITKDDNFIGILWSDPVRGSRRFKPNIRRDESGRGIGYMFGRPQIRGFCRRNNLSLIVRGHQPPMHGYERFSRRLITLFSAPGYRLERNVPNLGSSLLVDANGRMVIVRLAVAGNMIEKRQKSKLNRGSAYVVARAIGPAKKDKVSPQGEAVGTVVGTSSSNSSISADKSANPADKSAEKSGSKEGGAENNVEATGSNPSINGINVSGSKENIANPALGPTGSNTLVSNNSSLKVSSSKEHMEKSS